MPGVFMVRGGIGRTRMISPIFERAVKLRPRRAGTYQPQNESVKMAGATTNFRPTPTEPRTPIWTAKAIWLSKPSGKTSPALMEQLALIHPRG